MSAVGGLEYQTGLVQIDSGEAGALQLLKLHVERRMIRRGRNGVRYYGRRDDVLSLYALDYTSQLFAQARESRAYLTIPLKHGWPGSLNPTPQKRGSSTE